MSQPVTRMRFDDLKPGQSACVILSAGDGEIRQMIHLLQVCPGMWQDQTITRNTFGDIRVCRIGKLCENLLAEWFVGGAVMGYRQKTSQGMMPVMVGGLIF